MIPDVYGRQPKAQPMSAIRKKHGDLEHNALAAAVEPAEPDALFTLGTAPHCW